MRLHEARNAADIGRWLDDLDVRWPQRGTVTEVVCQAVGGLNRDRLHLVELCCGAGALAQRLLEAHPGLRYTGLDASALALEHAAARLAPWEGRCELVRADLNEDWPAAVGRPQAVVSMQALHDLGEVEAVERAYGRAARRLAPGGLLVNADLVEGAGQRPGRMPTARHLECLRAAGLERVACVWEDGRFACCVGFAPQG